MSAAMRATVSAAAATRDLWQLAETNDTSQLESILSRGADIDAVNSHGVTVLMRAAYYGRAAMVKALIEHGANPDTTRSDQFNPLLLAAFFGHSEVVRVLVEQGADLNLVTRGGTSADMWAAARSNFDIADYLRDVRNGSAAEPDDLKASEATEALSVECGDSTISELVPEEYPMSEEPTIEKTQHFGEKPLRIQTNAPEQSTPKPVELANSVNDDIPVVRTLKEPPDIWDLVHETPAHFNPGTAFMTRLTSSATNMVLAGVLVFLVSTVSAYGFLKFHQRSRQAVPAPTVSTKAATAPKPQVASQPQPVTNSIPQPATKVETATTVANVAPEATQSEALQALEAQLSVAPVRKSSSHVLRGTRLNNITTPPPELEVRAIATTESANGFSTKRTPGAESAKPAVSDSTPSQNKKASPAALSPQMIAPSTSSPQKAKVIQWP